jgi:hypothetical protein
MGAFGPISEFLLITDSKFLNLQSLSLRMQYYLFCLHKILCRRKIYILAQSKLPAQFSLANTKSALPTLQYCLS